MEVAFTCRECGTTNRREARFCLSCGAALAVASGTLRSRWDSFREPLSELATLVMAPLREMARGAAPTVSALPTVAGAAPRLARPGGVLNPRLPGEVIAYFVVLEPYVLGRSVYYLARGLICAQCHRTNTATAQHCFNCGRPLPECIVRETVPNQLPVAETDRDMLLALSRSQSSGLLPHQAMFAVDDRQYVVLPRPEGLWQCLALVTTPQPAELAVAWCVHVGRALTQLHEAGYAFCTEAVELAEPLILVNSQRACLADLTVCEPMSPATQAAQRARDMRYLARLLFWLTTGRELRKSGVAAAPAALRPVIERATAGRYASVPAMLAELVQAPTMLEQVRGLRQLSGYTTDVGRQRQANEDFVGQYSLAMEQQPGAPQLGLYLVADGMGGHEAGERASRDVVRVVLTRISELQAVPALKGVTRPLHQAATAGEVLEQAIDQANTVLVAARRASGSDRGTTLTAALVLGQTATVANVGDSRTYLLRGGRLQQVTSDHSLVASLVAAKLLTLEEARHHPQRNQIYRTLGDKPKVEIDFFTLVLSPGDMLLLCSDGLWEMVRDEVLQSILLRAASPQTACDELIRAANAAGGEDNISAIVVKLE